MRYLSKSLSFKVRKGLRYVSLYGLNRTLVKVRSQYHMTKQYSPLPVPRDQAKPGARVGILGCGTFAYSNIAYYLSRRYGRVMHAAMDVNIHRAASMYEAYKMNSYTDNADEVISDPKVDLLYIASNHATHAEYAIRALDLGKSVHIEKPHVVSEDQLTRLCSAMAKSKGLVRLGFNRPDSVIGRKIHEALDREEGPAMMNWFIAGHQIDPDHWYFKPEEGGRILGNLCHWTDFVYQMVPPEGRYPISINPTRWQKSDSDITVSYVFGNGTLATITFSAKGEVFEGVKERFSAHRGNALVCMDDFQTLTIELSQKKLRHKQWHRDHGHEESILRSYQMQGAAASEGNPAHSSVRYVWESGMLFLKTKQSLEENRSLTLAPYEKV